MTCAARSGKTRCNAILVSAAKRGSLLAAARVLQRGGVVSFPTETVYGLAVRMGDSAARARLRRVKRRSASRPFQILVSSRCRAIELCANASALVRKLARAFWPGPLTMVVRGGNGRWIGLRVPDHSLARSLARRLGGALVATSANLSGNRPARSAQEALAAVGGRIDLVLDGGRANIGVASSVVRVHGDEWELLRAGAISRAALIKVAGTLPVRKGKKQ